ncbi:unnamed protein product [Spirodela intermedia]|uniref:non-specific serine/threonine protein kinase n=1 Tax=Spirodela intermedia TaxID=51605 RepID=A0A7I8JGW7_SPIIN|nr:unnamed protein product [Spirodela intermedia]CAA6668783.1 unnamed protein product [Spirodela intermedia]
MLSMACRIRGIRSISAVFILFSFLHLACELSEAADTLIQGESLRDGETLISSNQVFELGFFTPAGGNSSARYVGIWYYGLPSLTVVWVGNRNHPISGNSSRLTFADDGNLVIASGAGDPIRITNSSAATGNSTLQLATPATSSSTPAWGTPSSGSGSTTPPTPSSRDEAHRGPEQSEEPPPPVVEDCRRSGGGEYSLGLDPEGSGQVFIWRGETPHWRSGQWNGRIFIGVNVRPLSLYGFNLIPNDEGTMVLTFTEYNSSLFRFVLKPEGRLNVSHLVNGTKYWTPAFSLPSSECEFYNKCGNNAQCVLSTDASGGAACECLRGFRPLAEAEWAAGNWTGGCVRRTPLRCGLNATEQEAAAEDGFTAVNGLNLPDFSTWERSSTEASSCADICLSNCSCTAYAFVNQLGCLVWSTPLADIHQFTSTQYVLYLKLAGSELRERTGLGPSLFFSMPLSFI